MRRFSRSFRRLILFTGIMGVVFASLRVRPAQTVWRRGNELLRDTYLLTYIRVCRPMLDALKLFTFALNIALIPYVEEGSVFKL